MLRAAGFEQFCVDKLRLRTAPTCFGSSLLELIYGVDLRDGSSSVMEDFVDSNLRNEVRASLLRILVSLNVGTM